MMFFAAKTKKDKYRWCNYKLNDKKNSANNVFKIKKTTNRVPPKLFRGFEGRKKVQFMFWKPKDNRKDKCYGCSSYKESNKECLVYLECKLRQHSYGSPIFKLKFQEMVETPYLDTCKQQTRYRWCF